MDKKTNGELIGDIIKNVKEDGGKLIGDVKSKASTGFFDGKKFIASLKSKVIKNKDDSQSTKNIDNDPIFISKSEVQKLIKDGFVTTKGGVPLKCNYKDMFCHNKRSCAT